MILAVEIETNSAISSIIGSAKRLPMRPNLPGTDREGCPDPATLGPAADLGRRLVLAQALVDDLAKQVVLRPVRNLTSATSSGRTQRTRFKTSGELNRAARGGGMSSGLPTRCSPPRGIGRSSFISRRACLGQPRRRYPPRRTPRRTQLFWIPSSSRSSPAVGRQAIPAFPAMSPISRPAGGRRTRSARPPTN